MSGRYVREEGLYRDLAKSGQNPTTMIIACCDSRAAPEMIFDAQPGELFVLRNVANLVPTYQPDAGQHGTSAAIEYAVKALNITDLVIMGHGRCGGIRAALNPDADPLDAGDFIGKWMNMLSDVAAQVGQNKLMTAAERQTALERIGIRNSINNLRTFPYVRDLEAAGKLRCMAPGSIFRPANCGSWTPNRRLHPPRFLSLSARSTVRAAPAASFAAGPSRRREVCARQEQQFHAAVMSGCISALRRIHATEYLQYRTIQKLFYSAYITKYKPK